MTDNGIPRDITLYLMAHSAEYREMIRQRVSEARKRQRAKDSAIRIRFQQYHGYPIEERPDVDHIGRDIEPCG